MKKKGDLLATCEPYVHVLLHSQRTIRCEACLERNESVKKCSACGLVRYCDENCQRADWNIHKAECPCYRRVVPNIPLDSVRLFLRLLIRQVRGDETVKLPCDPGWCTFNQLMSHKSELQGDPVRYEQFSQLMFTIKKLVGEDFSLPAAESMLELFGRMIINTFTICDGEGQAIGSGIYLSASKVDHSCQPNTVAVFRGKTLTLRAVSDIEEVTPEKLFISYIDQLSPAEDRQEALRTQYYFTCGCDKCKGKKLDEVMLATRCQKQECQGMVYRDKGALVQLTGDGRTSPTDGALVACTWCNIVPQNYKSGDAKRFIQESKEDLSNIEDFKHRGDFGEALSLCERFLEKRGKFLHDDNVYMVKCRDIAFESCLEMEKWETAMKYGEGTIRGFRLFYPPYSPIVGVHLMKIGKLELFLNHLQTALTHLEQARSILVVTHGSDHPLLEVLRQLIDQCQEEMRVEMEKSHKHPY